MLVYLSFSTDFGLFIILYKKRILKKPHKHLKSSVFSKATQTLECTERLLACFQPQTGNNKSMLTVFLGTEVSGVSCQDLGYEGYVIYFVHCLKGFKTTLFT